METKFKVGDVLNRTDEPIVREYLILGVYEEKNPFYTKVWYAGLSCQTFEKAEIFHCLKDICERCFEKIGEIKVSPAEANLIMETRFGVGIC